MKKTIENTTRPGEHHRLIEMPPVEEIRAKGEYRLRLTSLSIVLVLVLGGIIFSLLYPTTLPALWSVITPLILTILALALKNGKGRSESK